MIFPTVFVIIFYEKKIKTIMPGFNPYLNLGIIDVWVPRPRWHGLRGRSRAWGCDAAGSAGHLEGHTCRSRERALNAPILFYFTAFSPWRHMYLAIL